MKENEVIGADGKPIKTPDTPSITQRRNEQRFNGKGAKDSSASDSTVGIMDGLNRSLAKYLISDKIVELLNNQLQDELFNHNLYCTFALYYRSRGIFPLEEYFMLRAQEEMLHHNWIFGYMAYCGIALQYPSIEAVNVDIQNDLDPFRLTQYKEIETTSTINEIAKQALAEGDYGTFSWLNGTGAVEGKLIPEQTEEMSISNDVYRIAMQDNDWISKADAILCYYKSKR